MSALHTHFFLSCHSHPSPPSYPRTLTPQAMPVVLRTDPKLLTLCHLCIHALVHGATRATATAPQVMLHRRPASPCCACLPAPAAHCGLGSLWAASAVSGHYPHHGKCLVFGIHWFNRPTDCMLSPAASPQSQLVRFWVQTRVFTRTRATRFRVGPQVNPGKPGHPRTRVSPGCLCCVL